MLSSGFGLKLNEGFGMFVFEFSILSDLTGVTLTTFCRSYFFERGIDIFLSTSFELLDSPNVWAESAFVQGLLFMISLAFFFLMKIGGFYSFSSMHFISGFSLNSRVGISVVVIPVEASVSFSGLFSGVLTQIIGGFSNRFWVSIIKAKTAF